MYALPCRHTLLPRGRLVKAWTTVMVLVGWLNAITIPVQASFLHENLPLWALHYFMDLLCYINVSVYTHVHIPARTHARTHASLYMQERVCS